MRNQLKNILGVLIILGMVFTGGQYLDKMLNPRTTGEVINHIDAFHALPKNSVEVIIYGSSHAWKGTDSLEMYKKYGIGSYNYGGNWQRINTTSLFIKDSLRTQNPKIILIETYKINELLEDIDMNGEVYCTKAISMFDGKWKYLKQCFGDNLGRYLSYAFPLITFHSSWNNIDLETLSKEKSKEIFLSDMGYHRTKKITVTQIGNYEEFEQEELDDNAIKELDEIINICNEKNIEIIFYTVPYDGEYKYYKAVKKYAVEHGVAYINFFEKFSEAGFDVETDFQDETHLNENGAAKVADYLGEYIVSNYEVTDMRNVEDNLWEQCISN